MFPVGSVSAFLILSFGFWAEASRPQETWDPIKPGEFLVQLSSRPSSKNQEALVLERLSKQYGVVEKIREKLFIVSLPLAKPVSADSQLTLQRQTIAHLKALRELKGVDLAEPNYLYRAFNIPVDPMYGLLWGLKNSGGKDTAGTEGVEGIDIDAERAWYITTGSRAVSVAVIDTGIDLSHPDLRGNAWINSAELSGLPGVDDDGNGYVDDINGYDFVNNKGGVSDDNGHGTHCAGTIGATSDKQGIVGVAWEVSLMAVKFLDKDGSGTLANAIKSIEYAKKNRVSIMSNSWGGGAKSDILLQAIQGTRDAGILFVAAAGNDGRNNDISPSYPASYESENIISVAAINNRGELADFSNFGVRSVHVAAPGVNIYSSVPGKHDTFSGTSMATPHVSGVAALILSAHPTLGFQDLRERVLSGARPLAALRGKVETASMVDAYYSITGLSAPPDPNDPALWLGKQIVKINSNRPYLPRDAGQWSIQIAGAKRLSAFFKFFETEKGYDILKFRDASGTLVGSKSGDHSGTFSPIILGDTMLIEFQADDTIQRNGFEIEEIYYE